jgi:hypothetical protein
MLISRVLNLRLIGMSILIAVVMIVTGPKHSTLAQVTSGRTIGSGVQIIGNQYEISDLTYDLNSDGNPTTLDQLALNVHTPAGTSALTEVHVKLSSHSNNWYSCIPDRETRWLCDTRTPPVYVADMDELSIVVAE